jgi:hypothetical protein
VIWFAPKVRTDPISLSSEPKRNSASDVQHKTQTVRIIETGLPTNLRQKRSGGVINFVAPIKQIEPQFVSAICHCSVAMITTAKLRNSVAIGKKELTAL